MNRGVNQGEILLKLRLLLVVALLCVSSLFVLADPVSTVTVTMDQKTLNSPSVGGVIVAPYYLDVNSVNNAPFKAPSLITVICDDFADHVTIGEQWTANVTSLSSGNLSNTYFKNDPGALSLYEEASWLLLQTGLYSAPTDIATQNTANNIGNINFAIWQIFDSGVSGTSGWTTGTVAGGSAAFWLNEAQTKAPSQLSYYSGIEILTPVPTVNYGGDGRPQEYLAFTPEPSTFLLLGTGLVAAFRRRKPF